ncbi:hypothetical protein [Frigoriglobus tundricola]|nr:hypothetical protein [Frigoriglobus tundricola]
MATLFTLVLTVSAGVIFLFTKDLGRDPSVVAALVLGLGTPVLLGGTLYVAVYWSRVASNAEFGSGIELHTPFRHRRYSWTELARLELHEQGMSIPSRVVVKMMFTDGRRFVVFANRGQGEGLLRMAQGAPWARNGTGAALPATTASAFVGLGVVAIALGLWIICDPVMDVVRNGTTNNRSGIGSDDVGGLALVTAVVPLAGLAGIGVGGYHLIRRPIVIERGLFRCRAGEPLARVDDL